MGGEVRGQESGPPRVADAGSADAARPERPPPGAEIAAGGSWVRGPCQSLFPLPSQLLPMLSLCLGHLAPGQKCLHLWSSLGGPCAPKPMPPPSQTFLGMPAPCACGQRDYILCAGGSRCAGSIQQDNKWTRL